MKFFKHYVTYEGRKMTQLMDTFGHAGYACYFILLEMCAEKLETLVGIEPDANLKFSFSVTILRRKWRLSATNVRRMCHQCATLNLFSFTEVGLEFNFELPKFAESFDREARRARVARGQAAGIPRLELERELELEKELESNTVCSVASSQSSLAPLPARKKCTTSLVKFENSLELMKSFDNETLSVWTQLYPDETFQRREVLKAWDYYVRTNPAKMPKTMTGWKRALGRWFERGWQYHVKTIGIQPRKPRGIEEILKEQETECLTEE